MAGQGLTAAVTARPRRRLGQKARILLPLMPLLAVLSVVLLWPMLQTVAASFVREGEVGIGGYSDVVRDGEFRSALRYTLFFTGVTIIIEFLMGYGFAAALINLPIRIRRILTGLLLLPYLIAPAAAGLIWRILLDYSIGTVNWALGFLRIGPVNWLGQSGPAFWATVMAETWRSAPFVMLIVLAAMTALPADVMEAAKVDGANRVRLLLHIKLPLLRPAIGVALLFETIFKLRLFELPFVLTEGGPGSSTTPLGLIIYNYYFRYANSSTASVVAVVLLLIGFVIAWGYLKVFMKDATGEKR